MPKPAADTGHGRRLLSIVVATIACASIAAALLPIRHTPELPTPVHEAAPPPPSPTATSTVSVSPPLAEVELRRGDTLLDILQRAGIGATEAHEAVGSLRSVTNLRRLQVGQRLGLALDPDGRPEAMLTHLVLPLDAATEIHLVRGEDGDFAASSVDRKLRIETVAVAATIEQSFYAAGLEAGLPPATLAQMIKLLSWDIDFQRDLQPGDRLEAVYRRQLNDAGELAGAGELDFVGLATGGRTIEAYRHSAPDGRSDFYDRQGRSLRKWLLKTPVDGARLSSGFGSRRHPILGYTRMHRGIDFAAPTGTPVLAAGAGVVESAGRNRGYGNYLRLRHNRDYATAYGHLTKFAPGMRPGRRVEQGEVIGYVGATGLATGPHLHYELLVDGHQVNPLSVDLAGGEPLQGADLTRFAARRAEIDRQRRGAGGSVADRRPADRPPAPL